MKFNLATIVSLIIGLAGLVTAAVQTYEGQHPDAALIVSAISQIFGHFALPVASKGQ